MGLWDTIKSGYSKVDKALGGYLPGGSTPSEVKAEKTQTTTPTTSTPTSTPTQTTTPTTSTPTSSTSGRTSSGSSSSTGYYYDLDTGAVSSRELGQEEFTPVTEPIEYVDKTTGKSSGRITSTTPSGQIVLTEEQRIQPVEQTPQAQPTQTQTLQPGELSISARDYSPTEPPQRYEQPLGAALGQSFKNIFNFQVIGQEGFGAYMEQAFFTPFEYVGQPKAYQEMPEVANPSYYTYQGTIGGEPEKTLFGDKTYYEYGEEQKAQLFVDVGIIETPSQYTGEPTAVIPTRLAEKITGDIRPGYEEQLSLETQQLFEDYQQRVDTGELTVTEAQTLFEQDVATRESAINIEFQTEAQSLYSSKIGSIDTKKIGQISQFQAEIFEPPAYPIIRRTGQIIETGALIAATTFGGSGVTLAASGYMGIKTSAQANVYASQFDELTTGQKILGGVGIAAGIAATAYTFNLGINKFYSEWRQIIYSDLAATPAKVTGREVLKTSELTRYNIASVRSTSLDKSITYQRVDVYQTGVDRIGFRGTGVTKTTIFDPQYEKFITTTQKFTTSGYIPNIKEGVTFGTRGAAYSVSPEGFFGGVGKTLYATDTSLKSFEFISAAKPEQTFYRVAGATDPTRVFTGSTAGINYYSTAVRGTFDSAGTIARLTDEGTSRLFITSGAKSSQAYFNQLYGVGAAGAVEVTKQAGVIGLGEVSKAAGVISAPQNLIIQSAYAGTGLYERTTTGGAAQLEPPKQEFTLTSFSMPQLTQMLPQAQQQPQALVGRSTSAVALGLTPGLDIGNIPAIRQGASTAQIARQAQGLKLDTGNILSPGIPSDFTGDFTSPQQFRAVAPPIYFNLSPGGLSLPSNIIKGGQRATGYTPSFSALAFNIKGAYTPSTALAKSGIDFRPITEGFRFQTGLGGFNLRKIFRR